MNKVYSRINWHNNTDPAINETNLNKMDYALNEIDNRVVDLARFEPVARQSAEDSEAWAKGTRNGSAVPATDEAYHNNSKYYSERAESASLHPPYIGANGNWYVFDTSTGAYVDSHVDASITIRIGSTSTLAPGSSATVTNSGTNTDAVFNFGIPQGVKGDTGDIGPTPVISAMASVDANVGTPDVTVTKSGTTAAPSFAFEFSNIKGNKGDKGNTGSTPVISATATVNQTAGIPSVDVTKTGTDEEPVLNFAFSNIRGLDGGGSMRCDTDTETIIFTPGS